MYGTYLEAAELMEASLYHCRYLEGLNFNRNWSKT